MALPEIIKDIEARIIRPTSTDNAIVRFDGTTGQVQNSTPLIDDNGTITFATKAYQTNNIAGYYADQYGNFFHSRASTADHWQIHSYDQSKSLKYYPDTGELNIPTSVTSPTFIGSLNGNASTAAKWATARTLTLTGDVTGSVSFDGSGNISLTTTVGNDSHSHSNYLPLAGGTLTGNLNINKASGETGVYAKRTDNNITVGLIVGSGGTNRGVYDTTLSKWIIYSNGTDAKTDLKLYGAVWNDYAEYRTQKETIEPGYCVASADNGQVYKTTEKFQACDGIVSDTFGFAIGQTDECKTPLAVAGRVLAYCGGNREDYHAGDTVCAGPNGKVVKMTREEICEWPDRIIGIVSEIPEYETWGSGNVPVNGRIWVKIK